jgi:amino acid adenylation domain-containing protein
MERCHHWIIALMAIFKVGATYVPIDPALPEQRLRWMIDDTGARLMITRRSLLNMVSRCAGSMIETLDIDALRAELDVMPSTNLNRTVSSLDLSYVIYTSGSTGRPKGVMISHRGLSNVAAAQQRVLQVGPDSRVLQFASLSFDASIFEVFLALAAGGQLCIAQNGTSPGTALSEFLRRHAITIVTLPPSALAATPDDDLPALRIVTSAGEACPTGLVTRWAKDRRFFNLYGPTEATIWSTFVECKESTASTPIGKPIQNTTAYILDSSRKPVPVGVAGELYVGGVGLARGYLNLPELTDERFVDIGFSDGLRHRVYRTGDLARYLPDGSIDFLGRTDHQVKIRGFRVELGEIEAALASLSNVQDAAVVVDEDSFGDKRLIAYITSANGFVSGEDKSNSEVVAAQIAHWKSLYDETYEQNAQSDNPTLNLIGWNSSYTGQAIPEGEMKEQVSQTVDRVIALNAKRVLEIGCGTGLLLLRLASQCDRYVGTDFSPKSLDYVRRQLSPARLKNVELQERTADNFEGLTSGAFDAVVLNSVVQYFPDPDYLQTVLEGALRAVGNRGHIYIGDVRSLPLLEAFHTSVELERSPDTLSTADLQGRVRRLVSEERELVIDPRFFRVFQRRNPQVRRVGIQLRRGWFHNELTLFRYDVILQIGGDAAELDVPEVRSWSSIGSANRVNAVLERFTGDALLLQDIPNARLEAEMRALTLLTEPGGPKTVGQLRHELRSHKSTGVEPEQLWSLGRGSPYDVHVGLSDTQKRDSYDVMFLARRERRACSVVDFRRAGQPTASDTLSSYTNSPSAQHRREVLIPQVRENLQVMLPAYMNPSIFVLLDKMPLTPSGKVNRRALPSPNQKRPELAKQFVPPMTTTERAIAAGLEEVLGVEAVGLHDNFFDLGGHSLLLVRLHGVLKKKLDVGDSIVDMFRYPTISAFAQFLERKAASNNGPCSPGVEKGGVTADNVPSAWRKDGSHHV